MSSRGPGLAGAGRERVPNLVLRRFREQVRHEGRQEFADAMARVAHELGEAVFPTAQYVEQLESGRIRYPGPAYRRVLAELCGRPLRDLGFTGFALSVPAPGNVTMEDSGMTGTENASGMNRPLRDALVSSGMEIEEFARKVGVDVKTVQRWVMKGRVPHPRYRWKASKVLGRDESELWPGAAGEPEDGERQGPSGDGERVMGGGGVRACSGCGLPLSRYNSGDLCQACAVAGRGMPDEEVVAGAVAGWGKRLKELRVRCGLTQVELAAASGLSGSLVKKAEEGEYGNIRVESARRLAEVVGVPVAVLMTGEGMPGPGEVVPVAHGREAGSPGRGRGPRGVSRGDLAAALRGAREASGLSAERLAARCGLPAGRISKMETGRVLPSAVEVECVMSALGAGSERVMELVAVARRAQVAAVLGDLSPEEAVEAAVAVPAAALAGEPDERRETAYPSGPGGFGLATASEWPVWFGIKIAHLISLVDNWDSTTQLDALQTLLHREILMFDAAGPSDKSVHAIHALSRRQALVSLAALPLTLTASGSISVGTLSAPAATDFFLSRCSASLTACWHLLRGSDLPVVYQTLSSFLLALEGIAQKQSGYQQAAAKLASQAHRICGIVALHRNQLRVRYHHCEQALYYATVASDAASQASALISLASTYFYDSNPSRAAEVYEQTSGLESAMSPLQRSRVYAELSVVYGQLSREKDAIHATGLAEELYPDNPDQDRSYLYAEFTPASLNLESGLAYAALAEQYPGRGYQDKAAEIFARVDQMTSAVPDRIRFEVINHQARIAVLRGDLDAFETYVHRGLEGVVLLGSAQRQREMQAALEQAMTVWPREQRVKALSDGAHVLTRDNSVGGFN